MENRRTQIGFAPNIEKMEEMGVKWYNVVVDITDYLKKQGFEYSRTLGFVNDRELSKDEIKTLAECIIELAIDKDNLLYLNGMIINETIDALAIMKSGTIDLEEV